MQKPADAQLLTDQDLYLFNEGNHVRLYKKLGAHPLMHRLGQGLGHHVFDQAAGQRLLGLAEHLQHRAAFDDAARIDHLEDLPIGKATALF